MAYPAGVITRPVTFGPAFQFEDGATAGMQVTFKSTRPGVLWMETGSPAVSVPVTLNANDGVEQTVDLPVTDQDGWGDGDGNAIVPGDDGHAFLYIATVIFTKDGRTIPGSQPRSKVIPIPQGDGSPLDLDKLIPLTTPGGSVVSVPDIWSEQIAQAEAAALAAANSIVNSAAFVGTEIATTGTPAEVAVTAKVASLLPARQTLADLVTPFHYLHGVGSINGLPLDPAGTLVAVENAIAAHPSELVMVDLDYRRTRDSVLVSAHDATTGSASDVNVTIAATAFRDLPDIYKPALYGGGYGRVPIASHEAILSAARGRAVFSIEIKDGLSAVPDVIALTNRLGMADSIVWNTGDPTVVAALVAGGLKAFMFNCTTTTKLNQAAAAGAWMVDVPTDASTALIDHAIGLGFAHVIRGFVTTAGTPQATDSFAQLVGMDSRLSAAGTDATGYLDRPGGATLRSADSIAGAIRTGKRGPGWRLVNSSNLTDWLAPGRLYTYKAGSMVYTFGNLAGTPYPAGVSAGQSGAVQTITAKIVMDTLPTTLTQSTRLKLYSPTEAPANASANTVGGYVVGLQADGLVFLNSVPVGGGTPAAVLPNIQSSPLVAATEATVTCEIDDRTAGTQSIRITRQDVFVTLSSALSASTITSLPVTATPAALANGAKLMLADGTTVNVNGTHALGVTSITVTSIAVPAQASGSSIRATSGWVNETTGGKAIWRGRYHSAYTTQTTGVGALTDMSIA